MIAHLIYGHGNMAVRVGASLLIISIALTCCSLPVTSALGEQILAVPLFEVGGLWVRATLDLGRRVFDAIFSWPDFSSPWTYVSAVGLVAIVYGVFQLLFVPINRIRMLGDVGYIPEGPLSMKDMVNVVRKRRLVGDIPPVYPNGWFSVMETQALAVGEVKNVSCLGRYPQFFLIPVNMFR